MKQFDLTAFGEVLFRLSPTENERLTKCTKLNTQVGGAELNVVSGVSQLGLNTAIISKLPKNDLGTFAKNSIGFCGTLIFSFAQKIQQDLPLRKKEL